MRVTVDDIRGWLKRGKMRDASYMIVESDSFSYEYYPVYLKDLEALEERKQKIRNESMTSIREIYDMEGDWDKQLNSTHAWV